MAKKNFETLLEEAVVSDPGGLEETLIKENENYQKDRKETVRCPG